MKFMPLLLGLVLLFSCEKYEPLAPEAETNIFHPDSGVELLAFDSCYYFFNTFHSAYLEWTPDYDKFPELSKLTASKIYRDGVFLQSQPINDLNYQATQLFPSQSYDFQVAFLYDGRTTKLSEPCVIVTD